LYTHVVKFHLMLGLPPADGMTNISRKLHYLVRKNIVISYIPGQCIYIYIYIYIYMKSYCPKEPNYIKIWNPDWD
jgi:hypothetical protein